MNWNLNRLEETGIACGANKAKVIEVKKIRFDENLRQFCEDNVCGNYNKCYGCPPKIGSAQEVISRAKTYRYALVIQTLTPMPEFDNNVSFQEAFLPHYPVFSRIRDYFDSQETAYLALGGGVCMECETCAIIEDQPCRNPNRAVSSLSAYCVDVQRLAFDCGMDYTGEKQETALFSVFLFP